MSRKRRNIDNNTDTDKSLEIPSDLLEQFEIKHNIRYAFVNPEGQFFYRKSDAERYFKTFKIIHNPFI